MCGQADRKSGTDPFPALAGDGSLVRAHDAHDGGEFPTIVATIGDSTFFHSGIPALVNAAFQKARIIVVILDNATTAMTGHQPTPQLGVTASGLPGFFVGG